MQLGVVPYRQAWDLQRAVAGAVSQGAIPGTVLFLEHPPTITLGRRTEDGELHVPDGTTGVWLHPPPRKIASIGIHVHKWVTTHGYALNVDLDPAPFTDWITACGLEDAAFTTMAREADRPLTVDEVRPAAAAALERVFGLAFEELPAEDGPGLWEQPIHAQLAAT